MPKSTFTNLPLEKRELIYSSALDEFAKHSYKSASINRIVEACGIAKGSFYQYFANKADVYKYILSRSVDEKMKYVGPIMTNPYEHNFFDVVREIYVKGIEFAIDNPKMLAVGTKLLQDKDSSIYKEVMGDNMNKAYEVFEVLVKHGMTRGDIKEDVDPKLVSFIISNLNVSIVDYYQIESGGKFSMDMIKMVDTFIDIIKLGIGTQS